VNRLDDDEKAGVLWNQNAETWTILSRKGYDIYRDYLNTPAFLSMLPNVSNLKGLDIGCGEGHNTRLLAKRGAIMTGIDISDVFIEHAQQMELKEPLGIDYRVASALRLPFDKYCFDFVTAFMSMMDIPSLSTVVAEVHRVLKVNGFFQFSITHPVTSSPVHKTTKMSPEGKAVMLIADYFQENDVFGPVEEWIFSATPVDERAKFSRFKVPRFHRTLSTWVNTLVDHGFAIQRMTEPVASDEQIASCQKHDIGDTRIAPYFLHILCTKRALP
jgi:ubiquinone/menaquinone biosynthesis C-methylase UbiE